MICGCPFCIEAKKIARQEMRPVGGYGMDSWTEYNARREGQKPSPTSFVREFVMDLSAVPRRVLVEI